MAGKTTLQAVHPGIGRDGVRSVNANVWKGTEMTHSRQLRVVFGIGAAMLPLLLPGCSLIGRKEMPPLVVAPQAKEEAPAPQGTKVEQVGDASWYGPAQNGKETASGETFDQDKLTAASKTLPLGSKAVVTNLETGKSVKVTINDRGPYVKGRKIDLSRAAARQIGMTKKGVTKVKIQTTTRRKPTKKTAARRARKKHTTPVTTHTDTPTSPQ
jgi:rare lipoprotein A